MAFLSAKLQFWYLQLLEIQSLKVNSPIRAQCCGANSLE